MSKRTGAVLGLVLCGAPLACSNAGLLEPYNVGQAGSAAQPPGNAGTGGSAGTAAALTLAGLGLELPEPTPAADAGDAGDAGADAGSAELEFAGLALPGLIGWATEPALGTATTIGGAAGAVVTAVSGAELAYFASRPEPLVIRICGTLRAPELRITSHKTLLGVGASATLEGGIRIGGEDGYVRNVVLKNLRVNAATSTVAGEAVRLERAHHVWIDHCELLDARGDGALDIVNGSDNVSVSWTKFHFTADTPDSEHRFGTRIGDHNQDAALAQAQDTGHLNVTLHHNWFADDVRQRAPRVSYGKVHVFNSYYSLGSRAQDYSIWAATESSVRVENNYFAQVTNPHELKTAEAQLEATGNVYDGTTGLQQATGTSFTPPYAYTLDPALGVPQQVMQGAGPR
jgi:pectate lyase